MQDALAELIRRQELASGWVAPLGADLLAHIVARVDETFMYADLIAHDQPNPDTPQLVFEMLVVWIPPLNPLIRGRASVIIGCGLNGVHDLGGMHGFGPVKVEPDEPVFHAHWEGVVRAMMQTTVRKYYNLDEFRHAIERMPPQDYLRSSYYEKWLHAVETLLREKGVISEAELESGQASQPAPAAVSEGAGHLPPSLNARYRPGDRVRTRNVHPKGHTRLPRYARGKRGVIRTVNGPFLLPDANAHGNSHDWQACYAVEFSARELWGDSAAVGDSVCVDLSESYLDPEDHP